MSADAQAGAGGRITVFTSGKGGVGKTFVAANLAAALARQGRRVLLLDASLGLTNLDVTLDLSAELTLHDVVTDMAPLDDAIESASGGFSVLAAGTGTLEYSRLTPDVRDRLHDIVARLRPRFDHVLLDTAAGISDVVLYTVSLADEVVVVVTPEPTSLIDAYATIKVLAASQARRSIRLLVNQSQRAGEARAICSQLQLVVDRYVNATLDVPMTIELLGDVPLDASVREAALRHKLLLDAHPQCPAAQAIVAAAAALRGT
jgi:flagellar biosynthesis protein FlhG